MLKRLAGLLILALLTVGCATTNYQASINRLQMQVGQLQSQLSDRDEEVRSLRSEVSQLSRDLNRMEQMAKSDTEVDGVRKINSNGIIRISVEAQDIQKALKDAGYYKGKVDNTVGPGTKNAIIAFQRDHGLQADGIVGLKTWIELKSYIE